MEPELLTAFGFAVLLVGFWSYGVFKTIEAFTEWAAEKFGTDETADIVIESLRSEVSELVDENERLRDVLQLTVGYLDLKDAHQSFAFEQAAEVLTSANKASTRR